MLTPTLKLLGFGRNFPFNLPEGYGQEFLTNIDRKEQTSFQDVINSFDWNKHYQGFVRMVIVDSAMDIHGIAIPSAVAVHMLLAPEVNKITPVAQEVFELLSEVSKFLPLKDQELFGTVPKRGPDMSPFWSYYDECAKKWK